VRGASHERDGRPNQDAVCVTDADDRRATVIAVSDGHGGARYVRSELGSAVAVDVGTTLTESWWAEHGRLLGPSDLPSAIREDLLPAIVGAWRQRCLEHAAAQPFSEKETATALGVDLEREPILSYGATLLLAVLTGDLVVLVQLGDGDVVVASPSGAARQPVPGDDRLVGGQTTSLCLPEAVADFRVTVLGDEEVGDLVLLATDGYGNSFAEPSWSAAVLADLRRQLADRGDEAVAADLPGWLAESAEAGGDDVTVAIAWRRNMWLDGPSPGHT
jgi:hypothetical protein